MIKSESVKSPENVQECLFTSAINGTRNLICVCAGACIHAHYMTRPEFKYSVAACIVVAIAKSFCTDCCA